MIDRTLFSEEHELYRETVRKFSEKELLPYHSQWEKDGVVSRDAWQKAGAAGLLCASIPEEYGGGGGDFLHSTVVIEELAYAHLSGPGFSLHSEIVAPYIYHYGTEEQKKEWLPKMARGEIIGAIAMSEPGAGSDLQSIQTRALREGNHLVINGSKIFITNGQNADLVIVATKTDPSEGAKGISLVVVKREDEGFERGRNLEKIGWKAQDTSELFFNDVRVPPNRMLGEEGKGFQCLMEQLPQERLLGVIRGIAGIEQALKETIDYTKERQAFGKPIIGFQNTRFKLAEIKAQAVVTRIFVDKCVELHMRGKLDTTLASIAKLHVTELHNKVLDDCLQFHGGYGYMWEFPIARDWADARMTRIAGGTSEIMKEIISRSL